MIRQIIKKILPLVALSLLAASCGKDEADGDYGPQTAHGTIRFEIGIAPAGGVAPQTRVTTDLGAGFTSAFKTGDQVGLYIVKGDGELLSSGNYADNLPMTFDGTTWQHTATYPEDGGALSFYAYYPYDKDLADPLAVTFSVPTDQSTFETFSKGHLLMAVRKDVTPGKAPVQLEFFHQTAMLKVKLADGPNAWEKAPRPADAATLVSRYPQATFNLATGGGIVMNEEDDTRSDIKMYRNPADGCWYALLAPMQYIKTADPVIGFEWTALTALTYTNKGDGYFLSPGEVKPLDITIRIDMTDIDPEHAYAVGDPYPYKGFSKMGIVVQVSNDGTKGKIVSLDQKEGIRYNDDDDDDATGANSATDGMQNMIGMQGFITSHKDGDWSSFPDFEWVHKIKNGGNANYAPDQVGVWYLPSIGELQHLVCVATGNPPETWGFPGSDHPDSKFPCFNPQGVKVLDWKTFDAKVAAAGGTPLDKKNPYGSSSKIVIKVEEGIKKVELDLGDGVILEGVRGGHDHHKYDYVNLCTSIEFDPLLELPYRKD